MKKWIVTVLAVCLLMLVSVSVFAATPASEAFVCPNGNEDCVSHRQCTHNPTQPRMKVGAAATSSPVATQTPARSGSAAFVCPNGNEDCVNNGACVNNGLCPLPESRAGTGVPPRNGTGHHYAGAQGKGAGNGQGGGHHGGHR